MNESTIMSPVIQYGFAGLSVVLLVILVWLIRELLTVLKENNRVIATNTAAISTVDGHAKETLDVAIELKNEIYKRPCIARLGVLRNAEPSLQRE